MKKEGVLNLAFYTMKKTMIHLALSGGICALIGVLSAHGRIYAGFAAAFLGAAYLLSAWLRFLRSSGTDVGAWLRRKAPPGVPYFHRRDKQGKSGLYGGKSRFEDSLADEQDERDEYLPLKTRLRGDALSFILCGTLLLISSLCI